MAVWDSASLRANRAESARLHSKREPSRADGFHVEPDVANKWHPGATLAFIVLSCGLLWGGIFAAFGLIF